MTLKCTLRRARVTRRTPRARLAAEGHRGQRMGTRRRLDAELVRRGLARSREHAASLVTAQRVLVAGQAAAKPATQVDTAAPITVTEVAGPDYASRGGHKLAGALAAFSESAGSGPPVPGRGCLHRRLHRRSAPGGRGPRGRGGRGIRPAGLGVADRRAGHRAGPGQRPPVAAGAGRARRPDLVTADLSFISLGLVLPALVACAAAGADFVLLVKPQFEVGKDRVGAGGVVRDPELRAHAVAGVAACRAGPGLGVAGVVASPLPGPSGNVEYFLWLRRGAPPLDDSELGRRSRKDRSDAHRASRRGAHRPPRGGAQPRPARGGPAHRRRDQRARPRPRSRRPGAARARTSFPPRPPRRPTPRW